ncbi:MAG: hypothetical protein R3C49_04240 [Planctomycetaceae bacterium]
MLHQATYELEFPFEQPPEFLTIQQEISDENFIFPSEMKLTLHQADSELTYTESLKPGQPQTLRFDWTQTPLADDASDEDWEKWFEKQREATLGITSYSSVYSFIYVEPAEIRHEILIPLASLKTVLPMVHKDPAFIEVDEQDGVRSLIRDWLSQGNPVQINHQTVPPEFTRIDFYGLDLKDFARQAEQRQVSLANGRVGIILTYRPETDSVRDLSVTWETFNTAIRKIQSVVFPWVGDMQRFEFSRFNTSEENVFTWQLPEDAAPRPVAEVPFECPPRPILNLPLCTIMLAVFTGILAVTMRQHRRAILTGGLVLSAVAWPLWRVTIEDPVRRPAPIDADVACSTFQNLLQGAYRALDFGSESRIYEALSSSVDGDLLETLYLQLNESLQMREQGGAVARVRSVDILNGDRLSEPDTAVPWPGFRYRSQWTVSGTVEHWGHIHERQNRFSAVFSIQPRGDAWKITNMQIEDQESVATRTQLRRF